MIRSRAGWKLVTLLLVLLLLRAVTATVIELRIADGGFVAARLICLAGWIAILICLGLGLEWARFVAVMLLALGTAVAVAVLLDEPLLQYRIVAHNLTLLRVDLLVFIASNLAFIPLLAFSKPVRSYFAKIPNFQFPGTPGTPVSEPHPVSRQIRVASDPATPKIPPSGAAEWRQVNPARSERKQR